MVSKELLKDFRHLGTMSGKTRKSSLMGTQAGQCPNHTANFSREEATAGKLMLHINPLERGPIASESLHLSALLCQDLRRWIRGTFVSLLC